MSEIKKYGLDLKSCKDEDSIFEFECSCGRKGELIISKEISKAISKGGKIIIREKSCTVNPARARASWFT